MQANATLCTKALAKISAALMFCCSLSGQSLAGGLLGSPDGVEIFDTVIYWESDFYKADSDQKGFGIDGGFVTALNGDITKSGWTVTANIGFSRSDDAAAETKSRYGSVLVGYQWHFPTHYFALNTGVYMGNNDETPGGSVTDGYEAGVLGQYGIETKSTNAFYLQSYGSITSAFDSRYAHLKIGYKADVLKFGAAFTIYDDEGSEETIRYGGFVGDIPLWGKLAMSVSAGYQQENEPGNENGFYGRTEFYVPISLP